MLEKMGGNKIKYKCIRNGLAKEKFHFFSETEEKKGRVGNGVKGF